MFIRLQVIGEKDRVLAETERELNYDITMGDRGYGVSIFHPKDDPMLDVLNSAEDFMNENPELWANGGTEDYQEPYRD